MPEYLTMSLRECGVFDATNKLKDKKSAWFKLSEDRRIKGISRSQRVTRNKQMNDRFDRN